MTKVVNKSNLISAWPDSFFNGTILTNNNFIINDSDAPNFGGVNYSFSADVFTYIYSGFTENTAADIARNKRLQIGNMPLNLDYDDIRSYVYFGKASDVVIQEMNDIILNWPASLYVDNLDNPAIKTVTGVYYDPQNDITSFKIPVSNLYKEGITSGNNFRQAMNNPYGVVYSDDNSWDTSFLNLGLNYTAYTITPVSGNTLLDEYPILNFSGTTNLDQGYISIICHGNPFMASLLNTGNFANILSTKYHIKPAQLYVDKFFAGLTELQNRILNRYSVPKYEFNSKILINDVANNALKQSFYWPTTDYYNLDIRTHEFRKYLSDVREMLDNYDDVQTDILYRRLTEDSIIEYDATEQEKLTKYIRTWGWSYDKEKRYIDGISFVNTVSYDKKNNIPDYLIFDHVKKLGWDVYSPFRDLTEDLLYDRNVLDLMYPGWSVNMTLNEIETEMWRRFAINSIYYFKSKGTRKSVESVLSLLGIPDTMLILNEYVYTTIPIDFDLAVYNLALLNESTLSAGTYYFELTTSATSINNVYDQIHNYNYAIVNIPDYSTIFGYTNTGYPISPAQNDNRYFQYNGGWFENDPSYYSPAYFDSGKAWLDLYRNLGTTITATTLVNLTYSGSVIGVETITPNIGFTLTKAVDNIKSWVEDIDVTGNTGYLGIYHRYSDFPGRETDYSGATGLVINTKEIDMFLDFSKLTTTGTCVTTLDASSIQIPWLPVTPTNFIEGPTYSHLIQYIDNLDKFWIDIVKQMMPATSIFRVGVIYSNCRTGLDEYYFYNLPSSVDNLHFIDPYTSLSGDQFSIIYDYVFPFSGYSWTETTWLEYQSDVFPGLDPFNPFNMIPYNNALIALGYPGIPYFPDESLGDPPIFDWGAF